MPTLSNFIENHTEALIEDWVAYAMVLNDGRSKLSATDLRNSAPGILAAVVANMRNLQTAQQQIDKSHGAKRYSDATFDQICEGHAKNRLEQGFGLNDIVAEFRALRASVLRRWRAALPENMDFLDEMDRFHEAVDQALTESVNQFSKQAERARNLFAGVLAHDLRTPLSVILHSATLLGQKEGLSPECVKAAAFIQRSAARMKALIDDLLVFTRTRLGDELPLSVAPHNMEKICRDVAEEIGALFSDRTINVACTGDMNGIWDSNRIGQLFFNLLSNAGRYGTGAIDITAAGNGDQITIVVANEGKPIPEQALHTLFDPLTRINAVSNERDMAAGIGLGLYICRCIATAHKGTIGVESAGRRTAFTVRLPRRPRVSMDPPAA